MGSNPTLSARPPGGAPCDGGHPSCCNLFTEPLETFPLPPQTDHACGGRRSPASRRATPQTGGGQGDDAPARRSEGDLGVMNNYEPGISYPRRRDDWMRDHPLASRLLIMIVGFAVLVPIGLVIRASQGNVVRSGGSPGCGSLAADPADRGVLHVHHDGKRRRGGGGAGHHGRGGADHGRVRRPRPRPSAVATVAAAGGGADGSRHDRGQEGPGRPRPPATTAAKKAAATTAAPKPTRPPTTKAAPATTDARPTAPTGRPPRKPPPRRLPTPTARPRWRPSSGRSSRPRRPTRRCGSPPGSRTWCRRCATGAATACSRSTSTRTRRRWPPIGVTSAEQLYDPTINAQAAYLIFQRSGWAPWR